MAVEGRSARSGRVGGGLSLRFQDFGDVGLRFLGFGACKHVGVWREVRVVLGLQPTLSQHGLLRP